MEARTTAAESTSAFIRGRILFFNFTRNPEFFPQPLLPLRAISLFPTPGRGVHQALKLAVSDVHAIACSPIHDP